MPIPARRNIVRRSPFRPYKRPCGLKSLIFLLSTITTVPIHADGEISGLITSSVTATPSVIPVDGVSYGWGQGENLQLDGFFLGNDEFVPNLKANNVSVLRRDIPNVATGELCGVFAERQGSSGNDLKPDFAALVDHAGVCDMSAMLMSSTINRGTLDTFTNTGTHPNNIERIDYHFNGGIAAPLDPDQLAFAGHLIGEKHGNNLLQMAAITAMDESGRPAQYGPLVSIGHVDQCAAGGICYGQTSYVHDYVFFKSPSLEPLRDLQAVAKLREPVAFAFLSMETLGIPAGSIYYGISVFPHDINATDHNLLDISSFPVDTQELEKSPDDTADIYGGSASLYIKPSGVTGRVFCQADDGMKAPEPDAPISLFRDTIADGVLDVSQDLLVSELPGTTRDGRYTFLGLENGSYFVLVSDRADNEAAVLAVVIDNSPVGDADIFLDEACQRVGPKAFPDTGTSRSSSVPIAVLQNDENADGLQDAPELSILSVSESSTAELQIEGRTVLYTPSAALIALVTPDNPVEDTFDYTLIDDQGLTSEATVTVTIVPPDTPTGNCIQQNRTDCLFVETEVDGVGRIPPLTCLLLLSVIVIRRYALFTASTGDRS